MNKTERLAGIILVLSNRTRVTAKELSELFEVSQRTIYRDIQALSELQVPIVADKGLEGGYSLLGDYFMQPVMLTEEEVEAVYLGCNFLAGQDGFPLRSAAELALEKLAAVMAPELKARGEEVLQRISFNLLSRQVAEEYAAFLEQLDTAIREQRTVVMDYQSLRERAERKVDPYELVCQNDAWYCTGYCHWRGEIRQFKLARIRRLELTEENFTLQQIPDQRPRRDGEVLVRVAKETSLEVQVKESLEWKSLIVREDGRWLYLSFPRAAYSDPYLFQTVLAFGENAEIVEPDFMREAFCEMVGRIAEKYR